MPTDTPLRYASEAAIGPRVCGVAGREDSNGKRGAGVERRNGFGTREKLCRVTTP